MNFATCTIHCLPPDLICTLSQCRARMCSQCFTEHHRQTSHGVALVIGQASVDFFIKFTEYLIETISAKIATISQQGFQRVFSVDFDHSKLSFTASSSEEIRKACIHVLSHYVTLLQNNKDYVNLNKESLATLMNPQFLHDITSLFLESWQSAAKNLIEQVKGELSRCYPYRYYYRSLKFKVEQQLLEMIQTRKQKEILSIKEQAFIAISQIGKLSTITRISQQSNDGMLIEQIRAVSQSLKFIDSFQQILDSSFLNSDPSYNPKMILQESVETLSPRLLSQDAMERQLEQLLIQNERLKQENCHLRFENRLLAQENKTLSEGRH